MCAVLKRVTPPRPVSYRRSGSERGFMLVAMSLTSIALMGVLGLSVDLGRMFIAKNETQIYCDAAALAASLALDGTTTGITRAQAAISGSDNKWNLGTTTISNAVVTFATTSAGPWVANPSPAAAYGYVKVSAAVSVKLYFLPIVVTQDAQSVSSSSSAGQVPISLFRRGLAPYTVVSTNTTGPNFGLTKGSLYDIQWPAYNSTRANCSPSNPDRCFISSPCSGESTASKAAVVSSWGASIDGYWGSTSNSIIQQEILDVIQQEDVDIGTNLTPLLTSGNKASQAGYLDQRVSQDNNSTDNLLSAYLSNPHNGRRLIAVPIVNPVSVTQTIVIGYGMFLLSTNGSPSDTYVKDTNGNEPFCAAYAGTFTVGSIYPGVGGSTGGSAVKLVQ